MTLYASSTAGTVAVLVLTQKELSEPLPLSACSFVQPRPIALPQSSFAGGPVATGTAQKPNVLQVRKAGSQPNRAAVSSAAIPPAAPLVASAPRPANARAGAERLSQHIDILPGGKRRIRPTLLAGQEPVYQGEQQQQQQQHQHQHQTPAPALAAAPVASVEAPRYIAPQVTEAGVPSIPMQQNGVVTQVQQPSTEAYSAAGLLQAMQALAALQAPESSRATSSVYPEEQAFEAALAASRLSRAKHQGGRIVGGDLTRDGFGPSSEVRPGEDGDFFSKGLPRALSIPPVLSTFRREGEGGAIVEVKNYDGSRPIEITVLDAEGAGGKVQWMDFLPFFALRCALSLHYLVVAQANASLVIYTSKGRRLTTIALDSPVCLLECRGSILMAVTSAGFLHRWNVKEDRELHRPISCLGLLKGPDDVHNVFLHINGSPILILKTEEAWTIDSNKNCWSLVASGWFADCSPVWDGRGRGRGASLGGGAASAVGGFSMTDHTGRWREPIRAIESEINSLVVDRSTSGIEAAVKPPSEDANRVKEFELSAALRHLELRMQGSVLLGSREEYQTSLRAYARKIAEEGLKGLAEELIREFLGPIYYQPGVTEQWEANVLDVPKRTLCREVLQILGKSKALSGLTTTYQELLKSMA